MFDSHSKADNRVNFRKNGKKLISFAYQALFVGKKKQPTQSKNELDKYFGDLAPSILIVKKWFTDFRCVVTSSKDAERERPIEVAPFEIIEEIHMVLAYRSLKVCAIMILEVVGIANGSAISIMNDHLNIRKLPVRWVSRLLTINHKRNGVPNSSALQNNHRFTRIHGRQPEVETMGFFSIVMLIVFWDTRGVLHQLPSKWNNNGRRILCQLI